MVFHNKLSMRRGPPYASPQQLAYFDFEELILTGGRGGGGGPPTLGENLAYLLWAQLILKNPTLW